MCFNLFILILCKAFNLCFTIVLTLKKFYFFLKLLQLLHCEQKSFDARTISRFYLRRLLVFLSLSLEISIIFKSKIETLSINLESILER